MTNFCGPIPIFNCHDVEPTWTIIDVVYEQVPLGNGMHLFLFLFGHSIFRSAKGI
jgi:hypothetical protein